MHIVCILHTEKHLFDKWYQNCQQAYYLDMWMYTKSGCNVYMGRCIWLKICWIVTKSVTGGLAFLGTNLGANMHFLNY